VAGANSIQLVCENGSGPGVCLSAAVGLSTTDWTLLTLAYSETNTTLFYNDAAIAYGGGLAPVPAQAAPLTALVIGSSWQGTLPACGQIEEFWAFTSASRYRGLDFDPAWSVTNYYAQMSPVAALGPVTEAEVAAQRQRAEAARAERLAAQQAAMASGLSATDGPLDGGASGLAQYDPSQGFWLLSPQVVQNTNLFLTLVNCDTNIGYDIWYAPVLAPSPVWSILATGVIGQTTFTVPMRNGQGYLRGATGIDWDGDGIPNYMDADPRNPNVGALTITIDVPANGSTVQ
jgi:hypothetical protein